MKKKPTFNVTPNLSDINISIHDTFTALANLDPLKATGIDGIGPRLLKHVLLLCELLYNISSACLLGMLVYRQNGKCTKLLPFINP